MVPDAEQGSNRAEQGSLLPQPAVDRLIKRLPLKQREKKVLGALLKLVDEDYTYTPERGNGQRQIAELSGHSVRSVQESLPS